MPASDLPRLREQLRQKIRTTRWLRSVDPGEDTLPSADGAWPDLDYASRARSVWSPARHLTRAQVLATRALASRDRESLDHALAALAWWIAHDPQSDNWWHNQIGVPRLLAGALLLISDQAPVDLVAASRAILERSGAFLLNADGSRTPTNWTGANLLWMSANQLLAGALFGDEALIGRAMSAALSQVRVSTRHEEGIQVDGSFHQHGALLYNGSYGAALLDECLFFFEAADGTRWAPGPSYNALLADYILDGTRWMVRGADFNHGCIDRVITRPRETNARLVGLTDFLARAGGPRQAELEDFAQALRSGATPGRLAGVRMFYRSDFMVWQDPQACVSVRMHSRRTVRAECCNDEGKRSHHISDGLTYLLRTGAEYRDIFPVWDWQKLPGITCLQTATPEPADTVKTASAAESVGGVDDGRHGACTQHLLSGHIEARKSWFFAPDGVLCLGAGIRGGSDGPVVTTLDQSLVQGPVECDSTPTALAPGRHALKSTRWLRHGPWGFVFPQPTDVTLELGPKTGSWDLIGTGPAAPVTQDVFLAYVSHGKTPADAAYAYLIVPDADRTALEERANRPRFQIITNTAKCQAVWWPAERLLQAAFFSAGAITWNENHTIQVDHTCILMLRQEADDTWTLDVADPTQSAHAVSVTLSEPGRAPRAQTITLPDGDHLGRTVRARL